METNGLVFYLVFSIPPNFGEMIVSFDFYLDNSDGTVNFYCIYYFFYAAWFLVKFGFTLKECLGSNAFMKFDGFVFTRP